MTRKPDDRLSQLPALQRRLLSLLKEGGPATIARLAPRARVTREAVRQQLAGLESRGWVSREPAAKGFGRPASAYRLAAAAEELFPKAYDELAVELLDAAAETLGPEALRRILDSMAAERVKRWEPALRGKSLEERLRLLRDVYRKDDPYMRTTSGAKTTLVETNCPFFSVASRRPQLCSLTVSVLSRLLGRKVTREERFQHGHGRCVFSVGAEPVSPDAPFAPEPDN